MKMSSVKKMVEVGLPVEKMPEPASAEEPASDSAPEQEQEKE
jgi:hypothetical protein